MGYSPWGLKRAGGDLAIKQQRIVSEHCQDSVTLWAWSEWIYIERTKADGNPKDGANSSMCGWVSRGSLGRG